MAAEEIVDEVINHSAGGARRGFTDRPVHEEAVETDGTARPERSSGSDDEIREVRGGRRAFSEKQWALIAKMEAGEGAEEAAEKFVDETAKTPPATQLTNPRVPAVPPDAAAKPDPAAEWSAERERLAQTNARLVADLEASRRAPSAPLSERLQHLDAAEKAYVDEGVGSAFRRFLGVVLNVPHDSKEVDAELAGAYAELTAQELGVPLQEAVSAKREAARTRLALERDKRERKAESEKKAEPSVQDADAIPPAAIEHFGNLLSERRDGVASIADDHPMLMAMSEHIDGMKPADMIARALKHEIKIGSLAPDADPATAIRSVAKKIESYYQSLGERFAKAKPTKQPDTTISEASKTPPAKTTSQDQRQSTAPRTVNNAAASVAPATPPKPDESKQTPKPRSKKEAREAVIAKHFGRSAS